MKRRPRDSTHLLHDELGRDDMDSLDALGVLRGQAGKHRAAITSERRNRLEVGLRGESGAYVCMHGTSLDTRHGHRVIIFTPHLPGYPLLRLNRCLGSELCSRGGVFDATRLTSNRQDVRLGLHRQGWAYYSHGWVSSSCEKRYGCDSNQFDIKV